MTLMHLKDESLEPVTPVVSMVEFEGRLFVARSDGVFERRSDGKFYQVEFIEAPPPSVLGK